MGLKTFVTERTEEVNLGGTTHHILLADFKKKSKEDNVPQHTRFKLVLGLDITDADNGRVRLNFTI